MLMLYHTAEKRVKTFSCEIHKRFDIKAVTCIVVLTGK
jgi:hypothetical protein